MKFFVVFAVALALFGILYTASAVPLDSSSSESNSHSTEEEAAVAEEGGAIEDNADSSNSLSSSEERSPRRKRATCDLLSYFGVNHAACAAGCILKSFRGGYCDSKAICRCRN